MRSVSKRIGLALIVLAAAVLVVATAGAVRADITTGLVGHYTFDTGNANDSAGTNHGYDVGSPGYVASPNVLQVSDGNYVQIPNDAVIPTGNANRTFATWAMIDSYEDNAGIWHHGTTSSQRDFSLELTTTPGTVTFNGWSADFNFSFPGDPYGWHQFSITHDGSTTRAYVDGVERGSRSGSLNTAASDIRLGGQRLNNSAAQLDGWLDDFRVYDRKLEESDVGELFALGAPPLPPALPSPLYYAPNGSGGINAYEFITDNLNYGDAKTGAETGLPASAVYGTAADAGTTGHLASFDSKEEYESLYGMRMGHGNAYFGLTDDPALAPGAFEDGNNSGGALPDNGTVAVSGERGAGWAFVDTGLNQFHQRWPGQSIWNGGEPNNSGNEDAGEMYDSGYFNDIPASNGRDSIREWDVNLGLSERPVLGPDGGDGFAGCRDVKGNGDVNGMGKAISSLTSGGGTIVDGAIPYINLRDPQNESAGSHSFPAGGGPTSSPKLDFLGNTGGDDNDFSVVVNGYLQIPTTGIHTFGFDGDDGVRFTLFGADFTKQTGGDYRAQAGGHIMQLPYDTGNAFMLASTPLDAGIHPFELIYYENGGGAFLELFHAPGLKTSFDSEFRIVGDTQFGGLALVSKIIPEPSTFLVWSLPAAAFGLGWRRRKR